MTAAVFFSVIPIKLILMLMNDPHRNIWTENAEYLRPAFLEAASTHTASLIAFGIQQYLEKGERHILDMGGGKGEVAIRLASEQHYVTLVDIDPEIIDIAKSNFAAQPASISQRLKFIHGTVDDLLGLTFDIVCCHSVLMYEENWRFLLMELIKLVKPGGIISLVSVNPHARAMRLGRQGKWKEVIATINTGENCDPSYIQSSNISLDDIRLEFERFKIQELGWFGVGVFEGPESEECLAAEWIAGMSDPYRQVARCFHIIGKKEYC